MLSNTRLQSFSLAGISLILLKTSSKKSGFTFTVEVQLAIEDGLGRVRIVLKIKHKYTLIKMVIQITRKA